MVFQPESERHQSSIEHSHLETLYKTLFENLTVAIIILDEHEKIISWNTYAETLLCWNKDELFQQSIRSLYPAEEWQKIEAQQRKPHERYHHFETKIVTKNKDLIDAVVSISVVRDKDETCIGFFHLIQDISEQKRAEQRIKSIIEYADDSVYLLDNRCRYLMVNNELLSRLGCSYEKVIGKTFNDFHSPEETKEFSQKIAWVFQHGSSLKDEHYKEGKWFLRTLSPVKETVVSRTTAVLVVSKDITDHKKTEEMLAEKEKKYHTMFELFPQVILVIDTQGRLLEVNERISEWLGYKPDEIIGKSLFTLPFFSPESKETITMIFSEKRLDAKIPVCEIEVLTKNGEKRVGVVLVTPLKNESKGILTHLIAISDITERKNMEEAMRIKDSAITSSINAIALVDLEGNLTYVNKSFLKMWGYPKEKDVIGKPMVQFLEMKGNYPEVMDALVCKGEWVGELTGVKKDHSTIQVQLSGNMITDECDKPICLMVSFVDITQYNETVRALSESENKFRVVLENSLDMIYQLNLRKNTYDYVSPSSVDVVGYTSEEMMSFGFRHTKDLIHPDDWERVQQHMDIITNYQKKQDVVQAVEYRIKHKTLGYRWMSDTCSAIFDERHEPIAIVGNVEDSTDRKKVWDELVKSEEKYRVLAETSADGVFTTDALGRLTYVNPSFEKLCERRKSQILATPFRNYLLEDSIYFFQQIFIDVRKKNEKIENVELELVSEDSGIIPIEVNIAPLKKENEFSGVVCTVRDITQRRDIEDELKKNERLKTEFMNIAAHELRSPVTPIKGYLDLIIHDNESNEKIKGWAKISLRNTERLLKLVNDILDVARLDSDTMRFDMEKLDPVELLTEIAEDFRPTITNKKLEFCVNVPKTLPHILGDKNRLSQVLKNLIGNAIKFTDYGSITLEAEKKENHIIITVKDTGIGISKDEVKKLFTKFYQAYTGEDRNNEGTGLGLFISKEIVKKHKGIIWADSEVGKGSRFVVELPYIYRMTIDFNTDEKEKCGND
jgi:PAS domain S-box-containing protein